MKEVLLRSDQQEEPNVSHHSAISISKGYFTDYFISNTINVKKSVPLYPTEFAKKNLENSFQNQSLFYSFIHPFIHLLLFVNN